LTPANDFLAFTLPKVLTHEAGQDAGNEASPRGCRESEAVIAKERESEK